MSTLYTIHGANACWDHWPESDYRQPRYKKRPYKVRPKPLAKTEDCHVHGNESVNYLAGYQQYMIAKASRKTMPKIGDLCLVEKKGSLFHMCGIAKEVFPTGYVDVHFDKLGRVFRLHIDELCF